VPAISHILFPFDFSTQAYLAVRFVGAAARRFGAKVTVLSVVPPVWQAPGAGVPIPVAGDPRQSEDELRAYLNGLALAELEGICVQRIADSGDPATRITEFAHAANADLIMMPTHGTSLFRRLLIGSVTSKVLHDAACPVWTATHAEEQHSPQDPRRILCAVDGTPRSAEVMVWARDYSVKMDADLKLLHVVPSISDWLALASERELQEEVREAGRDQIQALQKTASVNAPLRVAVGQIVDSVTEEARQENADLLIIGRGSLPSSLGRLRTHAYGIIQKSPCPVLSV